MPRCARIKSHDAIFHIMIKSIKEVPLFNEADDKKLYLKIVKEYQDHYGFKVYAYCLMSNHGHLIIDANGADISKIMHSINFKYAQIFNKIHKRSGHLFQDRFKSKIVKNERYLIALSAYIHNNPKDIKGYESNLDKYEYSSLAVYLGNKRDEFEILDVSFIMQLFGDNALKARKNYKKLVSISSNEKFSTEIEFEDEKTFYKSERIILVRDIKPKDIMDYVSICTGIEKIKLYMKNSRNSIEAKAITVLLMRKFCNYRCSEICKTLGNITQARVSKLCAIGNRLIDEKKEYRDIINNFMLVYSVK